MAKIALKKTRKFGKQRFSLKGRPSTKTKAKARAKKHRATSKGAKARIAHSKGGWSVYTKG